MTTIFLRFADRAEACAVLAAALGVDTAEDEAGRQSWSAGDHEGVHYDLCFLADGGVYVSTPGDHVNLKWPGPLPVTLADALAPYTLPEPATPAVVF